MTRDRWATCIVVAAALIARATPSVAQCPTSACDPARLARRVVHAVRVTGDAPVIDGRLDEPAWLGAEAAADFVESAPRPAAPASLRSEARVLADADAVYVGLTYYDPAPGGIRRPLARRDDETTSDWAFVEIDSRHDRRSAFSFGVNPRGVQVDGLWVSDTEYDASWNAVWEGAAHVDEHGWTAEIRIPFSQLAFAPAPESEALRWGINFYRYSPAHGESSNWSPRYRGLGGVVSNFNDLVLPGPSRVSRVEITPYVAPRAGGHDAGGDGSPVAVGADLKVGLGPTVTLTGTVLPDFGQVEADPSQVNLTAFELYQAERRPFFLEGLDVFRMDTALTFSSRDVSFARETPFYSRRVGSAPLSIAPPGSIVPSATTLLGAAKLAASTSRGWTMGVFTAIADREQAILPEDGTSSTRQAVSPRTMFSVGRAVRTFDRGNASVGLFAADVHRVGLDSTLTGAYARDQIVGGVDAQRRFGNRRYEARGWALWSRTAGSAGALARVTQSPLHYFQRPDRPPDVRDRTTLDGVSAQGRLSRVNGALRWDLVARAVSPGFDVNEIGFQQTSDWALATGTWRYEWFRPGRFVRAWTIGSDNVGLGWAWAGERRAAVANGYVSLDTRSFWLIKLTATHEWSSFTMDRLRGGPALLLPPRDALAVSIATDSRKATYATLDATVRHEPQSGSRALAVTPLVNVRASDRVQWSLGAEYRTDVVGWQYITDAGALGSSTSLLTTREAAGRRDYIVGRLRQRTLAPTMRAAVILSPRLSIQAYAQPFATVGRYDRLQRLVSPRAARASLRFAPVAAEPSDESPVRVDLDGDEVVDLMVDARDRHERQLNANVVVRWEYRPGSFLTFVWSQRRAGAARDGSATLGRALRALADDDASTAMMLKASFRIGR